LKKLVIHAQFCRINVYRVINLTKYQDYYTSNGNGGEIDGNSPGESKDQINDPNIASEEGFGSMSNPGGSGSMSSMSSANTAFNRSVKDFKKQLGERSTPRNLLILNRILIGFLMLTVILSSIYYALTTELISMLSMQNDINLMSEERTLKIVQLASNVRSYINLANNLEFERYDGIALNPIDRFEYLSNVIQSQALDLLRIHQFLT